jgi:hypothetical protein
MELRYVADIFGEDLIAALRLVDNTSVGWSGFLRFPFERAGDCIVIAGAVATAYTIASSPSAELAWRRANGVHRARGVPTVELPRTAAGDAQSDAAVLRPPLRWLTEIKLPQRVQAALEALGSFAAVSLFVAVSAYFAAPEEGIVGFLVVTPLFLGALLGIVMIAKALLDLRRRRRARRAERLGIEPLKPAEVIGMTDEQTDEDVTRPDDPQRIDRLRHQLQRAWIMLAVVVIVPIALLVARPE